MGQENQGGRLRTIAVISLCAFFLILALGTAVFSSSIYQETIKTSDENYLHRTALSYLTNQLRRGDVANGVSVGSFHGVDALVLTQSEGEYRYVTYLYCWEGQLRELFTEEGYAESPSDGLPILPLDSLEIDLDDAGQITFMADIGEGNVQSVTIGSRTGVEEVGEL